MEQIQNMMSKIRKEGHSIQIYKTDNERINILKGVRKDNGDIWEEKYRDGLLDVAIIRLCVYLFADLFE